MLPTKAMAPYLESAVKPDACLFNLHLRQNEKALGFILCSGLVGPGLQRVGFCKVGDSGCQKLCNYGKVSADGVWGRQK